MARTAHTPDFLHLHANAHRRLRNLETGVHPLASETAVPDTIPPTALTITNPHFRSAFSFDPAPSIPRWQRRIGVVTMLGGVEPVTNWAALGTEETVGTLPAAARPLGELIFNGALLAYPWVCQYRVKPTGEISILKPAGVSGTSGAPVKFEGANWTTN
jgi:hypothetical protein